MNESTPRAHKRMIGADAVRIALEHERTVFERVTARSYNPSTNNYIELQERSPELFALFLERAKLAHDFAAWAVAEFKRTYDTSGDQP